MLDELEQLEHTVMAMVVQAITDYREQAKVIFREESDAPQDIAEDLTREAMDAMGLPGFRERLYGKVDFKRAIYAFVPREGRVIAQGVALMLDTKAEKVDGNSTATIQMSQTSMTVKMRRAGKELSEPGKLESTIERSGRTLYVSTIIAKYIYDSTADERRLCRIILACIPNGQLQERYNPTATDSIWLAGRNAPSRGEDFRVRLSYARLRKKAEWRVHEIDLDSA